jgi:hypothetical protein
MDTSVNELKSMAKVTVDSSLNYMNLGFTLAAALAWHESAKMLLKQAGVNSNKGRVVFYPIVVTLVAVLVFRMSKFVSPEAKRPVVVPVVSA